MQCHIGGIKVVTLLQISSRSDDDLAPRTFMGWGSTAHDGIGTVKEAQRLPQPPGEKSKEKREGEGGKKEEEAMRTQAEQCNVNRQYIY